MWEKSPEEVVVVGSIGDPYHATVDLLSPNIGLADDFKTEDARRQVPHHSLLVGR